MYISTKDWKNYIDRLSALDKKAGELMQDWIRRHGFSDTKAMTDYAYAIAQKYGEGSAALSAEMYDAVAEMQKKLYQPAEAMPPPEYGEVAKTVNGILKHSQNPNSVANGVSRLVKRTGADTTLINALRDGAEFAWVPNGDTCAFCITLASRGWQRMSKKALKNGHAEHIHPNCDCTYAVRFDGKSNVEGYDPQKYADMYYGAEGNTPEERINSLRRMHYEQNKDVINAQKRGNYSKRKNTAVVENENKYVSNDYKSVYQEYLINATPQKGHIDVSDREFKNNEERNLHLLHSEIGGDIKALPETNVPGKKNPDYLWRGHYWEEQEPISFSKNAVDMNVREAIHQIAENPGGIVLDLGESPMKLDEVHEIINKRLRRSAGFSCDVVIIRSGKIEDICRYKK